MGTPAFGVGWGGSVGSSSAAVLPKEALAVGLRMCSVGTSPPTPAGALRCSCDDSVSQSFLELVPQSGPRPDDFHRLQVLTPWHQQGSQSVCAKGSGCFSH